MSTSKTLKIRFTGYKFTSSGEASATGVLPGTWDSTLYSKTYSVPEAKVSADIDDAGVVSQIVYDNCYNAAKAMLFDGVADFGDITPVLVESGAVKGAGLVFDDAVNHGTVIEIYWETVTDTPISVE